METVTISLERFRALENDSIRLKKLDAEFEERVKRGTAARVEEWDNYQRRYERDMQLSINDTAVREVQHRLWPYKRYLENIQEILSDGNVVYGRRTDAINKTRKILAEALEKLSSKTS